MNNNKNFISEAKKFYKNKNFLKAKNCLLEALKFNNLDKTLILSINVLISDICYKLNENENEKTIYYSLLKMDIQIGKFLIL